MQLIFIRHAIAVDREDPKVKSDQERWLTTKGIDRMKTASKGFVKYCSEIDVIYTSSYIRAKQTAQIVAKAFKSPPPIYETDLLCPGASIDCLPLLIEKESNPDRVAFVGHEPDFSEMLATLLCKDVRAEVEFKKGAIASVEVNGIIQPGRGVLLYHLPPRVLRLLGE